MRSITTAIDEKGRTRIIRIDGASQIANLYRDFLPKRNTFKFYNSPRSILEMLGWLSVDAFVALGGAAEGMENSLAVKFTGPG